MAPSLFDDLDPELRRDREASGHTYSERPSERAANDAARHYVREYYGEDAVTKAAAVFPGAMQRKEHGIGDVRRDQRLQQPPDDLLGVACAVDPGVQLCGRFVRVRIARLLGRLAAATAFKTPSLVGSMGAVKPSCRSPTTCSRRETLKPAPGNGHGNW
jgi:hypothetical protein